MGLWKSIIHHHEFDAAVDHTAMAQIMKAKAELATTRIKCLLERFSLIQFQSLLCKGQRYDFGGLSKQTQVQI